MKCHTRPVQSAPPVSALPQKSSQIKYAQSNADGQLDPRNSKRETLGHETSHRLGSSEYASNFNERTNVPSRSTGAHPVTGGSSSSGNDNHSIKVSDRLNQTATDYQSIKYWHYKQTGVRSRPIKLLKHPIDHIERKILLAYILGLLFKLITLITGPPIVLALCLLILPIILVKRLIWFVLNLPCCFDARIRTGDVPKELDEDESLEQYELKFAKQIHWNYCPLSSSEAYWLKDELVNHVILVVDDENDNFAVDKLECLIKDNILDKPKYRKFLSRIVSKGLCGLEGLYWKYMGLTENIESDPYSLGDRTVTREYAETEDGDGGDDKSSRRSDEDDTNRSGGNNSGNISRSEVSSAQFSATSLQENEGGQICIQITQVRPRSAPNCSGADQRIVSTVRLSEHIYMDSALHNGRATLSRVRRYVHRLMNCKLDKNKPLWEIRVIKSARRRRYYLIIRCHQSLADGKTLANILTQNLSAKVSSPYGEAEVTAQSSIDKDENENENNNSTTSDTNNNSTENELKPLDEKLSYVARISRSTAWRSAVFVGPLTLILWIIWTFTRRKHNHLKRDMRIDNKNNPPDKIPFHDRRFYMTHYDLTRFHQIKQITRSTFSDVVLCALSGALREYLKKFNGILNPPNLNVSLSVDMRQKSDLQPELCKMDRDFTTTSECQAPQMPLRNADALDPEVPLVNCSLVNVPLPVSVEGVIPRLWDLRSAMDELRSSADPWIILGLQKVLYILLPTTWFRWIVNSLMLRNSSVFVSNIRGPNNSVESWCIDLFQKTLFDLQQNQVARNSGLANTMHQEIAAKTTADHTNEKAKTQRASESIQKTRLRLAQGLGSVAAIYFCLQPPTDNVPISFNFITYHNKVFITSLSRSLLVEDSKLFLRLFFKQLDQLAETIAKRRSVASLLRSPVPVEISYRPASPEQAVSASQANFVSASPSDYGDDDDTQNSHKARSVEGDSRLHGSYEEILVLDGDHHRDSNRCRICKKVDCICRRRKSLFSFDNHRNISSNLLNLLNPTSFKSSRHSRTVDSREESISSICECGESSRPDLMSENDTNDRPTSGSQISELDNQNQSSGDRPYCASCEKHRLLRPAQSTTSLGGSERDARGHWQSSSNRSMLGNIELNESGTSTRKQTKSAVLQVPGNDSCRHCKQQSKSETDLLPKQRTADTSDKHTRSKDSWFPMMRKGTRKLSLFSTSTNTSHKCGLTVNYGTGRSAPSSRTKRSVEPDKRSSDRMRRRRQSESSPQHFIVVKDETNADVSLRYQIDPQFLNMRNRRFSTIGGVVSLGSRRESLAPLSWMHNQDSSQSHKDNNPETHL